MKLSLAHLDLPDIADRGRCAIPKHEMLTRMDRLDDKKRADAADVQKLAVWGKAVKERDEWTDQYTGRKVKPTGRILTPDSAHAHHVEPRENFDTRYDVRNGITLSAKTHDLVERNEIQIIGTRYFTVKGKRYIDCTYAVKFRVLVPRRKAKA